MYDTINNLVVFEVLLIRINHHKRARFDFESFEQHCSYLVSNLDPPLEVAS